MQHPNLRAIYKEGQTVWLVGKEDGLPCVYTGTIHSVTTTHIKLKGFTAQNMRAMMRHFEGVDSEWTGFYTTQGLYAQAAVLMVFTNMPDALERARNATLECLLVAKQHELAIVKHAVALTKELMKQTGGDARRGGIPEEVDQGIFNALPETKPEPAPEEAVCEGCDGSGVRLNVDNGQTYIEEHALTKDEQIVERCDTCGKYDSDYHAAYATFNALREVVSVDGFHSIAASEPKTGKQDKTS